ncbi:Ribonuclease P protein component 3 [Thermococcus sp. M39]|uniref:Ribonuclease P protein component 3 n=1 Tax=unclassified Thermococcus TaxID=2627626 RepID=UPI001438A91D|nr:MULTISPECIES: Ribonuclease P protein component 3 [unclassified Thermococcus]NJE07254.1 Ribonuclease P protein component 3 [Thermococcus sp. M39]NJE12614.1 Ribonuclease P protein component 3 [Thermococcus sp. LS2]
MKWVELDIRDEKAYELAEEWYDEVVFTKKLALNGNLDYEKLKEEIKELREKYGKVALLVITNKPSLIREIKNRNLKALLYVQGGNMKINRFALEVGVDALISPEFGRKDNGFDHVLAKIAAKNDVAIGFSISQLLRANPYERANILKFMMKNWQLVEKYKVPRFLTSSAENLWEVRAPRDLMSLGIALGMEIPQAKASVSFYPEKIVKRK